MDANDYLGPTPVIFTHYRIGPGALYAGTPSSRRARQVSLQDGHCSLRGPRRDSSTNFYEGQCRELRTRHGRRVFIGGLPAHDRGRPGVALLDGTLVRLEHVQADP